MTNNTRQSDKLILRFRSVIVLGALTASLAVAGCARHEGPTPKKGALLNRAITMVVVTPLVVITVMVAAIVTAEAAIVAAAVVVAAGSLIAAAAVAATVGTAEAVAVAGAEIARSSNSP